MWLELLLPGGTDPQASEQGWSALSLGVYMPACHLYGCIGTKDQLRLHLLPPSPALLCAVPQIFPSAWACFQKGRTQLRVGASLLAPHHPVQDLQLQEIQVH